GLPMGVAEGPLAPRGWAIECRITSEDPAHGFLPSTGRIAFLRVPGGPGVRWDGGIEIGDEVTRYYDSLLGKLVVWGADRAQAIARIERALAELAIVGVATNQGFHRRLLADPAFRRGEVDIQFLERRPDLLVPAADPALELDLAVAAALAEEEARGARRPAGSNGRGPDAGGASPWVRQARIDALR